VTDEERAWARLVDRRSVNRGDLRRAALLRALDELLREQTLDEVNVAEISRRAGVTRSAFYFYFESKAFAVMALMAELYDAASDATDLLVKAEGEPEPRIRRVIDALFDSVERSPHSYRAVLEARATSPQVREVWEAGRAEFARMVAEMIESERAAGRATEGPDAAGLAAVLLDLNDHAVERHALGVGPPRQHHVDALTHIWMRSIYGTDRSS
jgi:TetR/AcrR family transcriptional regulator, ethionamide resistance regulator